MTPIASPTTAARATAVSATGAPGRPAGSPEAAARQFEAVLVRQFVEVMTKDLFDGDAEVGLTGQADLQRDTLTDTLTEHLVESGTFGVADLMIAQWKRSGRMPADASEPTPVDAARQAPAAGTAPRSPVPLDEVLRRVPSQKTSRPAQGPPGSHDHPQAPLP